MKWPHLVNSDTQEAFNLGIGETTIGRSPRCKIVVKDPEASAQHAAVFGDSLGQFVIRDLGSTNGTFINGKKVGSASLSDGDSVSIAGEKFGFHMQDGAPPPPQSHPPSVDATIVRACTGRTDDGIQQSCATRCSECGEAIPPEVKICRNCGAPAVGESPASPFPRRIASSKSADAVQGVNQTGASSLGDSPETLPAALPTSSSAVWSPIGIGLLFLPFGCLWSSAMIALNWHALRKHWFAGATWLFAIIYLYCIQFPLAALFPATFCYLPVPNLVGILVWFPVLGVTQLRYFQKHLTTQSSQRSWLFPVSLGIAWKAAWFIWISYAQIREVAQPSASDAVHQESEREYTAQELAATWESHVPEVETRWKETSWIFFTSANGGNGSAVLIRAAPGSLYFVTNRHVVVAPAEAKEYTCKIHIGEGNELVAAEVLAFGKNDLDLALLRVRAPNSRETWQMPMSSMKSVVPGQPCVAIGNALGAGRSVTTGIISRFDDFGNHTRIRTSAPISPGNSGGALFSNKGGFLLGITTAIIAGENAQNVNSVIPADYFAGDDAWDYLPGMSP